MASAIFHRRLRKWHRYLGVIFGIQFLFWTIGGFYFSWTRLRSIRGDDIRKELPALKTDGSLAALQPVLDSFHLQQPLASLQSVQLAANPDGNACYQLHYSLAGKEHVQRANAYTGALLPDLTASEAGQVAIESLKPRVSIDSIYLLTEINPGHEYRGKPLPAWAVVVKGEANCTVYVGQETGQVHSIRNASWRVFDFLWMLHIADYGDRENINNTALRLFSAIGIITLLSGYLLFFVTRRRF